MGINLKDYVFCDWKEDGWKSFKKREHELRKQGFRKVEQEHCLQDMCVTYKRKKQRITLVMLLS